MAAMFSLKHLVDLMSLATLVCYTIVAMSVLILRYRQEGDLIEGGAVDSETTPLIESEREESRFDPNKPAFTHVPFMVYLLTFLCAVMAMSIVHIQDLPAGTDLKLWPFFCFQILIFIVLILICFQGMAFGTSSISFQVPGLPLTPTLSIFFNLYLMFLMDLDTWIRFAIWLTAGLFIYFGYGLKHSKENQPPSKGYEPIPDSYKEISRQQPL